MTINTLNHHLVFKNNDNMTLYTGDHIFDEVLNLKVTPVTPLPNAKLFCYVEAKGRDIGQIHLGGYFNFLPVKLQSPDNSINFKLVGYDNKSTIDIVLNVEITYAYSKCMNTQ